MSTLEVTQLNVGWFTAAAGIWRSGESMERQIRFPIMARRGEPVTRA